MVKPRSRKAGARWIPELGDVFQHGGHAWHVVGIGPALTEIDRDGSYWSNHVGSLEVVALCPEFGDTHSPDVRVDRYHPMERRWVEVDEQVKARTLQSFAAQVLSGSIVPHTSVEGLRTLG